jgi:hypothetical protein
VLHRMAAFCFTLVRSPLFEIAPVVVRLDHVAGCIIDANDGTVPAAVKLRLTDSITGRVRGAVPKPSERQSLGD